MPANIQKAQNAQKDQEAEPPSFRVFTSRGLLFRLIDVSKSKIN